MTDKNEEPMSKDEVGKLFLKRREEKDSIFFYYLEVLRELIKEAGTR